MEIRDANNEDLKVLMEFEQEIIRAERNFDSCLKDGGIHYYNFQELLGSDKAKVLVVEVDNEVVGSGYAVLKVAEAYLKFEEYAYIGLMYVKPEHRGKGFNQQVLQALKDWVIGRKVSEIRLVVYDENSLAKNAYLKAGFKAHVLEMRLEV